MWPATARHMQDNVSVVLCHLLRKMAHLPHLEDNDAVQKY